MTVFASSSTLFRRAASALLLTGWVVACGPDLQPEPGDPPPENPPENPQDTHLRHVDNGDGTFTTTVDATSQTEWIGMDLDTRRQESAGTDAKWDVAFQRFHIRTRGGTSGTGGVEVAMLSSVELTQVSQAPQAGYTVDAVDGDDEDTNPDSPFEGGEGWYSYDLATHKLTPRAQVYFIRSDTGAYFKLQLTGYYDAAGTPAMLQFRWGPVQAPAPAELQVNAESSTDWTFLQAGKGVVQVSNPESSLEWDVAVRRTQFRTNGGVSGPGVGGARIAEQTDFPAVQRALTVGYVLDEQRPVAGPPGSGTTAPANPTLNDWYDYDLNTHVVTPKNRVFLVRTARGDYARLRITSYASGKYSVLFTPVPVQPETVKLTVDASDASKTIGVRLGQGTVAALTPPTEGFAEPAVGNWDISFKRTWLQTNSGTSGSGQAGALVAEDTEFSAVTRAAEGPYTADTMLPVAGPPGSGEASGNAVLNDWYDYDTTTHVVTPKARVFLVKTVEGAFAKVRILTYSGGTFTLEYTYSGPGRTSF
ncbi:HmuY family protein [Stigmatella aurantiaca]|uniref:Conserved uncharacterized protein n=1 Tax=Stigmatella aurantiaca (strain DW4/3-1) TaxID=378806 RepID=Q09A83_STIAD|nr:HmuY family protein [Stigmatella aurantiaca]ADO75066.1 conserved uncharacterized protein [Stigmatella aurantiaca DW4/3-1]EAU68628.1 hypothetical protein STIAU_6044 [Stigmatella aurantiaca DW4/3-1]